MGYLEDKADRVINNHVMVSMGAGAIPVPLLDVAAVTAIQLDLIRELSYLYDADFSETVKIIGSYPNSDKYLLKYIHL